MAKISESASKLVIDALQTILAASDKVLTKDEIEFLKRLQSRLEPPLIGLLNLQLFFKAKIKLNKT